MEQIILQLPLSSGQVFDVRFLPQAGIGHAPQERVGAPLDHLTPLQEQSLEALFLFKHATADLLLRYLNLKSIRHLQRQLASLHPDNKTARFIEYVYVPRPYESRISAARFGSSPIIYTLGRKGHQYLKKQGFPVGRYRDPEAGVKEELPLRHRLAVNEFLLKALLLEEEYPDRIRLLNHWHEQYWKGNPLKVTVPQTDKPQGLSPDLLLAFEIYELQRDQRWLPVEVNLSREWEKDWQTKVTLYRYCLRAYRQRLGTNILTTVPVMVASPASFPRMLRAKAIDEQEKQQEYRRRQRRMELMLRWTEQTLEQLNRQDWADMFSFSCEPLDELTPEQLFYGEHWYNPFSDTPRPLISRRKAGVS